MYRVIHELRHSCLQVTAHTHTHTHTHTQAQKRWALEEEMEMTRVREEEEATMRARKVYSLNGVVRERNMLAYARDTLVVEKDGLSARVLHDRCLCVCVCVFVCV